MRKRTVLIVFLCLIFIVSGCKKVPSSKVFSFNELSITLTDEFREKSGGYLTLYTNDVKIVIQSTSTASINNLPLEEYAVLLEESIGFMTPLEVKAVGGAVAYEYTLEGEDFGSSRCLMAIYKTDNYYYNVTFACAEDNYESYRELFIEWVDSIQIG